MKDDGQSGRIDTGGARALEELASLGARWLRSRRPLELDEQHRLSDLFAHFSELVEGRETPLSKYEAAMVCAGARASARPLEAQALLWRAAFGSPRAAQRSLWAVTDIAQIIQAHAGIHFDAIRAGSALGDDIGAQELSAILETTPGAAEILLRGNLRFEHLPKAQQRFSAKAFRNLVLQVVRQAAPVRDAWKSAQWLLEVGEAAQADAILVKRLGARPRTVAFAEAEHIESSGPLVATRVAEKVGSYPSDTESILDEALWRWESNEEDVFIGPERRVDWSSWDPDDPARPAIEKERIVRSAAIRPEALVVRCPALGELLWHPRIRKLEATGDKPTRGLPEADWVLAVDRAVEGPSVRLALETRPGRFATAVYSGHWWVSRDSVEDRVAAASEHMSEAQVWTSDSPPDPAEAEAIRLQIEARTALRKQVESWCRTHVGIEVGGEPLLISLDEMKFCDWSEVDVSPEAMCVFSQDYIEPWDETADLALGVHARLEVRPWTVQTDTIVETIFLGSYRYRGRDWFTIGTCLADVLEESLEDLLKGRKSRVEITAYPMRSGNSRGPYHFVATWVDGNASVLSAQSGLTSDADLELSCEGPSLAGVVAEAASEIWGLEMEHWS